MKWRTGCEGRVSSLKRQYGWDRTRIDSLEGARTWAGQGVFTSNLVKIAALTSPVPTNSTTGGAAANRSTSIPTPRAQARQRKGSRDTRRAGGRPFGAEMMAAGPAGVPAAHVGLFPPRPGSPATNPWLVFAFMGSLTWAIAWIAVTWQRIRTSGGVLPSTITVPLADHRQAATDPVKVLVNALRAVRRVVGALIRWLVAEDNSAPRVGGGDGVSAAVARINTALWTSVRPQRIKRVQEPRTGQGQRIPVRDLVKIAAQPRKP